MKIKELHKDIERYLQNDCYCSNEIYSFDGIFYQCFYEEQECEKLGETHLEDIQCVACIAHPFGEKDKRLQVIIFWLDGDKCYDAVRFDATENNIELTKILLDKGIKYFKSTGRKFDEYVKGSTVKSLNEVLNISNAIMI